MDETFGIEPPLAERWTYDEARNTYRFVLGRGVRFHDGHELIGYESVREIALRPGTEVTNDPTIPVAKTSGTPYIAHGHVYPPASPTTTKQPAPQTTPTTMLDHAAGVVARFQ